MGRFLIVINLLLLSLFFVQQIAKPLRSFAKVNLAAPQPTPPDKPTSVQEPAEEVLRIDTNLVPVPVSVLDRDGRFIADLRREDFQLFEEGKEQTIAFFATVEQPFSVVLLIDTSPSTRDRRNEIREAAVNFIDQLRPSDRVMVIAFDSRIRVIGDAVSDRDKLCRAVLAIKWDASGTLLYGAVDAVINHFFNRLKGRKALVMLSDGEDNDLRRVLMDPKRKPDPNVKISAPSCKDIPCATYESNMRDVEESDVLIYPIEFAELKPPANSNSRAGEVSGEQYLKDLALKTGGRFYNANREGSLLQTFTSIAQELRHQYSLGYYAQPSGALGERREIKVRVSRPGVAVRARRSYVYAPRKK